MRVLCVLVYLKDYLKLEFKVCFQNFSCKKGILAQRKKTSSKFPPIGPVRWDGSRPRIGVDCDGERIIAHFPGFLWEKDLVSSCVNLEISRG